MTLLKHVRETGQPPGTHQSHDHLNRQTEISVDKTTAEKWRHQFQEANYNFVIVDGFILYWSQVSFERKELTSGGRSKPRRPHSIAGTSGGA